MDVGHFKLLLQPLNYLIVAKEPGRYQSSDILKNWLLYLQAQGGFSLIKKSKKKKKINGKRVNKKTKKLDRGKWMHWTSKHIKSTTTAWYLLMSKLTCASDKTLLIQKWQYSRDVLCNVVEKGMCPEWILWNEPSLTTDWKCLRKSYSKGHLSIIFIPFLSC